jgi:DNA-binding CsgD family transcriptional regulator
MLKENEWILINEILLELYQITDTKKMRKRFLESIRLLIPYSQASFTLATRLDDKVELTDYITHDISPDILARYQAYYKDRDYLSYAFSYAKSMVYRDSDLVDEPIRRKTDFYREFLEPGGIPFAGGLVFVREDVVLGVMTLFRSKEMGNLKGKDVFVLDVFKNHLENMLVKNHNNCSDQLLGLKEFFLSKREVEVLYLLNQGYGNSEIADKLVISLSTVKKHINSIYRKMNVKSRIQLIHMLEK